MDIDCEIVAYEVCGIEEVPAGFSALYYFDADKVTTFTASAGKDTITGLAMAVGDKAKFIATLPNSIEITDPVQGTSDIGQYMVETLKTMIANPNSIAAKKLRANLQMCSCRNLGFIIRNNGGTDYMWSPDPAINAAGAVFGTAKITFEAQEVSTYGKKASEPAQMGFIFKRETSNSNFVMLPITAVSTGYIE